MSTFFSVFVDLSCDPVVELLEIGEICVGPFGGKVTVDDRQLESVLETETDPNATSVLVGECCCELK